MKVSTANAQNRRQDMTAALWNKVYFKIVAAVVWICASKFSARTVAEAELVCLALLAADGLADLTGGFFTHCYLYN